MTTLNFQSTSFLTDLQEDKMKAYFKTSVILFLAIIFVTGCSSSPHLIEKYPDFLQRKDHISSIVLCADVLVVYDGVESGVVIDIPLSLIVGDSILSIFKQELKNKNYPIGEIFPPAVGYSLAGDETYYRVFETIGDYSLSTDSLKMSAAPFVIEDEFLTVEGLLNKKAGSTVAIPAGESSRNIGRNQEGEYLLYINLEAQNVSAAKRISEGLLTTLITLGAVTSSPEAVASASYWLYDLQTGNIVLSDGRVMRGPDLSGDNVVDLLEEMLEEIPSKGL